MEIRTEMMNLSAPDGQMPAYLCRPASGGPHPGVIVIQEAFGLNGHIKDVTERIAREGYVTMAPDLFYRFGSLVVPYEDIPKAIGYIQQLEDAKVMTEVGAVIAHLKTLKVSVPTGSGLPASAWAGE
jgi:carboxymethylenebutenolidase